MTTENNKIIAKFMGATLTKDLQIMYPVYEGDSSYVKDLKYHLDWNWLMEVVEKIESLGYRTLTENECFMITKSKLSSFDVRSKDDYNTIFSDNYEINHYGGSKKENVYNACLEFIKWYNENKIQTRLKNNLD